MSWLLVVLVVLATATFSAPPARTVPSGQTGDCAPAARGYRTCFAFRSRPTTIERWSGSSWKVVAGPLKHADDLAQWGTQVWLSPDGRTLLAYWTFPCDSDVAVFIPAKGGEPRIVTGEADWRRAPLTYPLGWTSDGKARVQLLTSWRGIHVTAKHRPVLLFDPDAPAVDAHPAKPFGC